MGNDNIIARILVKNGEGPLETIFQVAVEKSIDPAESLPERHATLTWQIALASIEKSVSFNGV